MGTNIFVNLPVQDLERTKTFFSKLGFMFNPQFTDENALCMIIEENIFAMLLKKDFFKRFTKKEIADAGKSTEAIVAISAKSRDDVDEMVNTALKAGGTDLESQDEGWMYERGFEDLDGHLWEIVWMDPAHIQMTSALNR